MNPPLIVVTARPSWARVQTVCEALIEMGTPFELMAVGSTLLPRYGRVYDEMRAVCPKTMIYQLPIPNTLQGQTLEVGALVTGVVLQALTRHLAATKPSLVVTIADRRETLATAIAASYQHIPLLHLLGGERSGNIDDKVRDAVTVLADYVACPTVIAFNRTITHRVPGGPRVEQTGCPSVDLALRAKDEPPVTGEEIGAPLMDLSEPFLIILQHSVTNHAESTDEELKETWSACERIGLQVIFLQPGEDPGRQPQIIPLVSYPLMKPVYHAAIQHLPSHRFYRLLTQCACLIGNSSVGVREAGALGVPVVDIGDRQVGRLTDGNVCWAPHDAALIESAIRSQLGRPRPQPSTLYGDGQAGKRVAEWITEITSSQLFQPGSVPAESR
jgi:UDP-hydrolysing UDP-N-acetyl-D-glucosamine 2-epimerase